MPCQRLDKRHSFGANTNPRAQAFERLQRRWRAWLWGDHARWCRVGVAMRRRQRCCAGCRKICYRTRRNDFADFWCTYLADGGNARRRCWFRRCFGLAGWPLARCWWRLGVLIEVGLRQHRVGKKVRFGAMHATGAELQRHGEPNPERQARRKAGNPWRHDRLRYLSASATRHFLATVLTSLGDGPRDSFDLFALAPAAVAVGAGVCSVRAGS